MSEAVTAGYEMAIQDLLLIARALANEDAKATGLAIYRAASHGIVAVERTADGNFFELTVTGQAIFGTLRDAGEPVSF